MIKNNAVYISRAKNNEFLMNLIIEKGSDNLISMQILIKKDFIE